MTESCGGMRLLFIGQMVGFKIKDVSFRKKRFFLSQNAAGLPIYMSEGGRRSAAGKEKQQKIER